MPDQPLTLLQAAFMEAVRPTPAGHRDSALALIGRVAKRHGALHGPHLMKDCPDQTCRSIATVVESDDPLAAHGCLHAAVVVYKGRRVWYPCRSHEGGVHRFLARLDACPAPWCRLPNGHRELHDIPSGKVEIHDAIGVAGG